jgi:hypothetical protein
MAVQIVCPRCGARDSFMKGFLPETCVCRVCQSQLDWREIPGCGPDCKAVIPESPPPPSQVYVTGWTDGEANATDEAGGDEVEEGQDDAHPAAEGMVGREHREGDR